MSAKIYGEFGGCKFVYDEGGGDEITATFTGGAGWIVPEPIYYYRSRADDGTLKYRLKGVKYTIHCEELYNIDDDDYEQYQNLALILSALIFHAGDSSERYVTVYPRFNSAGPKNLSFDCIWVKGFVVKDVAAIKLGQVTDIDFEVIALQNSLPTLVSDESEDYLVDEGDDYLIDEGADYLTDKEI